MALTTTKQTRTWNGSSATDNIMFSGTANMAQETPTIESYNLNLSMDGQFAGNINYSKDGNVMYNIPSSVWDTKKADIETALVQFKTDIIALYTV